MNENKTDDQLTRLTYKSTYDNSEQETFVYLPKGYDAKTENKWPNNCQALQKCLAIKN